MKYFYWTVFVFVLNSPRHITASQKKSCLADQYRPQIHYSPKNNWLNDPNGMLYYKGEYHLYYQYYPYSTKWGPMHWGKVISSDLTHWTELPIALYPDKLGVIFSGSGVVDYRNSSGLAQNSKEDVIIAIFTHDGTSQQQSIAFSNNRGKNYSKFDGNPVIPNPGIKDFRDPKVIRLNGKWIMTLAAGNKVIFYHSDDLKSWSLLSRRVRRREFYQRRRYKVRWRRRGFGAKPPQGSHGGVWECPDLLPILFNGETLWVLLVSINPGGPNSGSATQYFIGDFDGTTFRSLYPGENNLLWMDWGPDNYAGVTFFNEPNNKNVLTGWMSNWLYADVLPTLAWRGQFTFPRELHLRHIERQLRLASVPTSELSRLRNPQQIYAPTNISLIPSGSIAVLTLGSPFQTALMEIDLTLNFDGLVSFGICFFNSLAQELCFGYAHVNQKYFLDRTKSGNIGFHPEFSRRVTAARESRNKTIILKIFLDVSSIEVFADGGLTTMTALFFPDEPFTYAHIHHYAGSPGNRLDVKSATIQGLSSINDC
nr:putative GH32 family protein [Catotricha subobsoleta]